MKLFWKILLVIFFIFPLALVIVACFNWNNIKSNFFTYSLSDIVGLLSAGYIGIIVMIVYSTISNNSIKRREIISENITMFLNYIENVLFIFSNCQNLPINNNFKKHIINRLRIASKEFSSIREYLLIEKIEKDIILHIEIIKENLINFKQAITDKPFQKGYKVKENDIQYATDSYFKLKQNIQKIKMNLYV